MKPNQEVADAFAESARKMHRQSDQRKAIDSQPEIHDARAEYDADYKSRFGEKGERPPYLEEKKKEEPKKESKDGSSEAERLLKKLDQVEKQQGKSVNAPKEEKKKEDEKKESKDYAAAAESDPSEGFPRGNTKSAAKFNEETRGVRFNGAGEIAYPMKTGTHEALPRRASANAYEGAASPWKK